MAYSDCTPNGNSFVQTPNLQRLANEGMSFDHAFLTTSSCSPSRASIITGKYPHQTDAEQLHWPLPAHNITFVERLRRHGYWTGQAGKWHFGNEIKDRFDLIMPSSTAGFVLGGAPKDPDSVPRDGSGGEDWVTLLNARDQDKPFFLWLAAIDPHRGYQENTIARPHLPSEVVLPSYIPDHEEVRKDFALYYDEISRMDMYIGRVLNELDKQNLSEQTLVVFISDNGRPFPREKTTLYDAGIRTPMFLRWPDRVQPKSRYQGLISSLDLAPTFLRLAQADVPPEMMGIDFSPLLIHNKRVEQTHVFAEDHWHDFEDYGRAIRTRDYKLIVNYYPDLPNTPPADALRSPTFSVMQEMHAHQKLTTQQARVFAAERPPMELYHVSKDPEELVNLAADPEYAPLRDSLRSILETIRSQSQDVVPSYRTPDEFTRDEGLPLPVRKRPRASKAEMEAARALEIPDLQ